MLKASNGVEAEATTTLAEDQPVYQHVTINMYTSTSCVKIEQPHCFNLEDLGSFQSILWMSCLPRDQITTPSYQRYVSQQWEDQLVTECCGVWSTITETSCDLSQ